jgi:hypothetical protein
MKLLIAGGDRRYRPPADSLFEGKRPLGVWTGAVV